MAQTVPHVPVTIYTSKFAKPIKVIIFLDIGAAQTTMNPSILPEKCWKRHVKHFTTASNEVFSTHLISRPDPVFFWDASSSQESLGHLSLKTTS